jgi:DNA repair protein RadA/Sms
MPKQKTQFVCSNCAFRSPRWQGRCPQCGEWNSFVEQAVSTSVGAKAASRGAPGQVRRLSELSGRPLDRISSGINELDSVLGGGMVPGSLVLLGGDPGIGKSTLALQLAVNLEQDGKKVLYISGEESPQQIKLRETRLTKRADIPVLGETSLETVLATLVAEQPDVAIVDSVQTLNSEQVNGVVGGVSQITFATSALMRIAKEYHITILLIGHVTKEGMLAGPKMLEHMVDTVLYLEGERFHSLRILRSSKNRFGSAGEVGVFEMRDQGLVEVANPSELFLENRDKQLPGSCTAAIMEGNKVLLLEVQALTNPSNFGYPRRTTSGFDLNRLQLILAILQKNLGLNLSAQDVFVNVAGGFKIDERAADLPVALAILSSMQGKALPGDMVVFGEMGLLGEIRGVPMADKRAREADKLGFKTVLVGGRRDSSLKKNFAKLDIENVTGLRDLAKWLE